MANRFRGEATLNVGAEEYILVADINALAEAEEETGLDLRAMLRALDGPVRLKLLRGMLWALLQRHHAPLNLLRAGEIVGDVGIAAALAAVAVAIGAAFPAASEAKDADENPPKAGAGTGRTSTGAGARRGSSRKRTGVKRQVS